MEPFVIWVTYFPPQTWVAEIVFPGQDPWPGMPAARTGPGEDPWPGPMARTRGQDPWPGPLARTPGQDPWPGPLARAIPCRRHYLYSRPSVGDCLLPKSWPPCMQQKPVEEAIKGLFKVMTYLRFYLRC
jgi:hypothetical protein